MGVPTPESNWMSYLQMAEANGFPLVKNQFPKDSSHLAVDPSKKQTDPVPQQKEGASVYNPEWNPTGIEGGVDTNKLPWIDFPAATGWSYKPLRASSENGMFSLVCRLIAGSRLEDLVHLGACDLMVLSGKMTFPSGPMAGTLQEGVFAYIPADAVISSLKADEDVEYLMNCYGPFAFLDKNKSVAELITSGGIQKAAAQRGITLIPSTLSECLQDRPEGYKGPPEPLAISDAANAGKITREREGSTDNAAARINPHYVDTKALKWFESMPGVGLKILRVSEETGVVTVMVKHNAAAPPHYHLGAADFFMLQGHLGYRAGPPEGYGPGTWFFEPAGARHESTQPVNESEDSVYLANIYGPIQFDSGVGTPIAFVFSWMSYLQMAEANGFTLVKNQFPKDSSHLAVDPSKKHTNPVLQQKEAGSVYNPEWNPTGIEGGVDTNKLPWIDFPAATGWSYKPLRASCENGMFSLVCRLTAGSQLGDLVHLGACDLMVLSGKMTFPSGPMAGTLQEGVLAYIPADAVISSLEADEDVEYVMNCYGPLALLNKNKSVAELITSGGIQKAAAQRGITLIPSTLSECLQDRPEGYKGPPEPLAIADPANFGKITCEKEGSTDNAAARINPHYVDTKALKWFESMPGVGLKILRVSEV